MFYNRLNPSGAIGKALVWMAIGGIVVALAALGWWFISNRLIPVLAEGLILPI